MNNFLTYLEQRFHPGIFSMLALFLLLFSKKVLVFGIEDMYRFILLLVFLLIMRLYDDLQNFETDQGKANRIYTDKTARRRLEFALSILVVIFFSVLIFFDKTISSYFLIFFLGNNILYKLLLKHGNFKNYLPLLKYPFIFICLNGQCNTVSLALFIGMIAFEILDDPTFSIDTKYRYGLTTLAIILLLPNVRTEYIILTFSALLPITFILSQNVKRVSYLFLLLFLVTRLIFVSYAVQP